MTLPNNVARTCNKPLQHPPDRGSRASQDTRNILKPLEQVHQIDPWMTKDSKRPRINTGYKTPVKVYVARTVRTCVRTIHVFKLGAR